VAAKLPDFSTLVVAGPELKDLQSQPTGKADGVIYLGSRNVDLHAQQRAIEALLKQGSTIDVERLPKSIPSLELQAYRYLRPAGMFWRALNGGSRGIAFPNIAPILATPIGKDIRAASKATMREIQWGFCPTENDESETLWEAAENANQPEHAGRWVVVKVPAEEFIWCVFYVASVK
jgi:hypothetical protein